MDEATITRGFDEWLRRYTEDPDGFRDIVGAVLEAQAQRQKGAPLTYGQQCLATLKMMAEPGAALPVGRPDRPAIP